MNAQTTISQGRTADEAWASVERRIGAALRKAKILDKAPHSPINGASFFGLTDPRVKRALEKLPGADKCFVGSGGTYNVRVPPPGERGPIMMLDDWD